MCEGIPEGRWHCNLAAVPSLTLLWGWIVKRGSSVEKLKGKSLCRSYCTVTFHTIAHVGSRETLPFFSQPYWNPKLVPVKLSIYTRKENYLSPLWGPLILSIRSLHSLMKATRILSQLKVILGSFPTSGFPTSAFTVCRVSHRCHSTHEPGITANLNQVVF